MLNFLFKLFTIALACILSFSANARWANIDDASLELKFYNKNITIQKIGTSENVVEMQVKVLKEQGRDWAGHYVLYYNGDISNIKILEAKTINNGREYKVAHDMVEDKPLASSPAGFDQRKQVLISFPNIEIGSEIYLKYIQTNSKPNLENFYSDKIFYYARAYWQDSNIKVHSEIPLYLKFNDPNDALKIVTDNKNEIHNITIKLKKPIYSRAIMEPDNGVINPKHLTWIVLSTLDNWSELASKLAPNYEKVINQPLPELFSDILKEAKKKSHGPEQINVVTSMLNEKLNYMGDWRSVSGKFFPRDLKTIADSCFADCKDFSATTAAILRKLGYDVHAAIVMRGDDNLSFENDLPDIGNFNHAFLKVIAPDGATYWIDPTNLLSMAQGMFNDVAGKRVLVLDPNNPSYEVSPNIDPQHSQTTINNTISIVGDKIINKGEVLLQGESALILQGSTLHNSVQAVKDIIFYELSGEHLETNEKKEISLPDLKSRIVGDIKINYEYEQNNKVIKTNIAPVIIIRSSWINDIINVNSHQISDIIIASPRTINKRTIISNKRIKQIENLNYSKFTPWVDVERHCEHSDNNTVINEKIVIKKRVISMEETRSEEFKSLKNELLKYFQNLAIVLVD